jgi:hypothetical protein
MASLTAVKLDADLKYYYERKVAEGKSKMSVLNAVKNKIVSQGGGSCNQAKRIRKKCCLSCCFCHRNRRRLTGEMMTYLFGAAPTKAELFGRDKSYAFNSLI